MLRLKPAFLAIALRLTSSLAKCYIVTVDVAMVGIMSFVRSHRRWGAWAGLAALTLQIVLSFGHIHPEDLGLPPAGSDQTQAALAATSHPAPNQPGHDQSPDPDDYCAICASMALVATAIPSLPPTLDAPVAARYHVWSSHARARGEVPRFKLSIQARGPPTA